MASSPNPGEFFKVGATYLGGIDGIPPRPGGPVRQNWHWNWQIHVSMGGVTVTVKENKLLSATMEVASQGWDGLRGVFFEPSHSTSNPLAIAGFGVLGLGARIDWMVMDIRFTPEAAFATPQASAEPHIAFLTNAREHEVKLAAEAIERAIPAARAKFGMLLDLNPVSGSGSGREQLLLDLNPISGSGSDLEQTSRPSLAQELDSLAGLHERGLLSDEEFATAKRRILESD